MRGVGKMGEIAAIAVDFLAGIVFLKRLESSVHQQKAYVPISPTFPIS